MTALPYGVTETWFQKIAFDRSESHWSASVFDAGTAVDGTVPLSETLCHMEPLALQSKPAPG
jgi:hypothetical protein